MKRSDLVAALSFLCFSAIVTVTSAWCANICGNTVCEPGETYCNCPADCARVFGDLDCNGRRGIEDAVIILQETAGIHHDLDGDEYLSDVDCDDNNSNIYPGAVEECDGLDNDCDTLTDEGLEGLPADEICAGTLKYCLSGVWHYETPEEICDSVDNDCDGMTDDGIPPQPCYTGPTGTENVGTCSGGQEDCSTGSWGVCQGEVLPQAEACDGLDNDCDGETDEGIPPQPCYTGPTGTENVGTCSGGQEDCSTGSWGGCQGEVLPQAEACDDLDNDCNGLIDDSCN